MKYFRYANFDITKEALESYIEDASAYNKKSRKHHYANSSVTNSIIELFALGDIEFDTSDREMCQLAERLIVECGRDYTGKYTQDAYDAMKRLCAMRGVEFDASILGDKKSSASKFANKIKSWFTHTKEKIKTNYNENKTSWHKIIANTTAMLGVDVLVGLGIGITIKSCQDKREQDDKKEYKTEYNITTNMALNQPTTIAWPGLKITKPVTKPTTPELSEHAIKVREYCTSALDIVIGKNARQKLCAEIRNQVDLGIFKIPNDMSVERVAHAMTMSRIYEGKSIILDALKSYNKLTDAQQAEFENYIKEVGERGEKIQKRAAKKQTLTNYSKYDQASKKMQKTHAKNLHELHKMRGYTR